MNNEKLYCNTYNAYVRFENENASTTNRGIFDATERYTDKNWVLISVTLHIFACNAFMGWYV